jgi:hypothetical protein
MSAVPFSCFHSIFPSNINVDRRWLSSGLLRHENLKSHINVDSFPPELWHHFFKTLNVLSMYRIIMKFRS